MTSIVIQDDCNGNAYENRSGTVTTGGTSQMLMGENRNRQGFFIANPNATGSLWVHLWGGTAVANAAGCVEVPAGATLNLDSTRAASVVHSTTGAAFTCGEY